MSMKFRLERLPSPVGGLLVVSDCHGVLRALDFADYEARMHRLLHLHYGSYSLSDGSTPAAITQALAVYFDGDLAAIEDVPVKTGGTVFQRSVWEALRAIPPGSTMSYGQLAAEIGRPTASRAVGLANGANPIVIVVPCHRVIGSNGTLTGYGGGITRKLWLLQHESVQSDLLHRKQLLSLNRIEQT